MAKRRRAAAVQGASRISANRHVLQYAQFGFPLSGGADVASTGHKYRPAQHRSDYDAAPVETPIRLPDLAHGGVNQLSPAEAKIDLFRSLFRGREYVTRSRHAC